MPGSMVQSPFPHMQAKAAAGAAAEAVKTKKDEEARELVKTCCWNAGILIVSVIGAVLAYQFLLSTGRSGRLNFMLELTHESSGDATIVRTENGQHVVPVPGKFFLEIGHSAKSLVHSEGGKHLENLGWSGVCAVPFAPKLTGRTCKVVALPIAAKDGVELHVKDCSQQPHGLQWLISKVMKVECPEVSANTVSLRSLLAIANAPKVIDYVSLHNKAYLSPNHTQLDTIKDFPFGERCVRAWYIWTYDADDLMHVSNLLEVAQGCKVKTNPGADAGTVFARCPCTKSEGVPKHVHAIRSIHATHVNHASHLAKPANVTQIEISASGQGRRSHTVDTVGTISHHASAGHPAL